VPPNQKIDEIDNEIGKIYKKDDKFFINFKKIITKNNKELTSVHSGNQNPILLPIALPSWTIFRKQNLQ
jgi:putative protease